MAVRVIAFDVNEAGDAAGLQAALHGLPEGQRLVLLGKIPGPATLNDPSRELSRMAFAAVLGPGRADTPMLLSVGCEGIASAGGWLLVDDGIAEPGGPARLAIGYGTSESVPFNERGVATGPGAEAVRRAMDDAGLTPDATRLVLLKSPVRRSQADATGRARGVAALGAAEALGEVTSSGAALGYCTRAMAMSGTETDRVEAVVFGNRAGAGGSLVVLSAMLSDMLDIAGLRAMLDHTDPALVLFKAGLPPGGILRGRQTQAMGTDMPTDKHLRAAASGILGAVLGNTRAFITGGAEFQGPPGACIAAAITQAR